MKVLDFWISVFKGEAEALVNYGGEALYVQRVRREVDLVYLEIILLS